MRRREMLIGAGAAIAAPKGLLAGGTPGRFWTNEWPNTDFSRCSVPFEEIISGGVPRDAIPALSTARFTPASDEARIPAVEPVVTVALGGEAERAYPVRYLTWHEIVNDQIGGTPVAVTFCPLCNSALVFDRRAAGQVLDFGVSGKLRHSDMIMFDRQTESWWQQFTGEAVVGALTGTRLETLVSWMESFEAFRDRNPDGSVMMEPDNVRRPYGRNPYDGYDSAARPFLYRGENPPHGIPPMMRVVRIGNRAWPLSRFEATPVIEEAGHRLSWQGGMASALDSSTMSEGRDIGAIRVTDLATGRDAVHEVVFAFAFHAFAPDGIWMLN